MENPLVGIDLGTTNSAIGLVDAGFPVLLANEEGERLLPSVVWFGEDEIKVGKAAQRELAQERTVRSAKRAMGLRSLEAASAHFPNLVTRDGGGVGFDVGTRQVSPEEVGAEVLRELKRIAEMRLETEVGRAVITVPAYFNNAQRAATKRAGELAGLKVERLLAEPTAAALSYGQNRLGDRGKVAVFDLGGGTFDVSILELREGVFEVLATGGDTQLGGDDLSRAILAEIGARTGCEAELRAELRSWGEAERVKIELSQQEHSTFRMPFMGGAGLECELSQEDLERQFVGQIAIIERLCREVMSAAKVVPSDLAGVVLVGGSSRIPFIQDLARRVFECDPDLSQNPDESIAMGAAIQAGILAGTWRETLLLDVTPLSLGIETLGGLMNVLIPRNTTIPCKAGEMFTNAQDGQHGMRVKVLQGERELAKDNWELGQFDLSFSPAPRGKARVGVQFSLDENGILEVLARDVEAGRDVVVEIESAVDVSDEAVEQMVSESVEHAFEDMNARIFAEARLKAEELLPAVGEALSSFATVVAEEERESIEEARRAVEGALEGGVASELKEAVEKLDRETEALAARLVEAAMAERLGM